VEEEEGEVMMGRLPLPRVTSAPAEKPGVYVPSRRRRLPVELWAPEGPRKILSERYFAGLDALGVTGLAVMVDTAKRGWDPYWKPGQLEKLAKLASTGRDVEVILTTWSDPAREYLAKMVEGIRPMIEACGAVAWEVDVEFNWKPSRVQGLKNLDLAGDALVDFLHQVRDEYGVRLELTTFTAHTENGRAADVAPHVDLLMVQAYSIRTRPGGQKIPWNHSYGPGHMQRLTLDRTLLVPGVASGKVRVGVGLAAWDQKWPGATVGAAMRTASTALRDYDVERVRYWSAPWVVSKKNAAAAFLRELKP
jgi:hypothetical protein